MTTIAFQYINQASYDPEDGFANFFLADPDVILIGGEDIVEGVTLKICFEPRVVLRSRSERSELRQAVVLTFTSHDPLGTSRQAFAQRVVQGFNDLEIADPDMGWWRDYFLEGATKGPDGIWDLALGT